MQLNHTHSVMWPNHTHFVTIHPSMLSESWSADCYTCRDMVVCMPRVSVCELEADGLAADILNRHELSMCKATENLTRQCLCVEISDWTFNMLTLLQPLSPPSPCFLSSLPSSIFSLPPTFSSFTASRGYPGLAAIWEEEKQRRLLLDNNASLSPPPSPGILPNPHKNTWCSLDSLCCRCM